MSCDGGHLGFPIGIKNSNLVKDIPMIIHLQFGFSQFKLYMNVHWMVLYKLYVFCSDIKFKMAATAGLSLTLDPMGKMFQNACIYSKQRIINVRFTPCHHIPLSCTTSNFHTEYLTFLWYNIYNYIFIMFIFACNYIYIDT
jgi:hypothetical protein